MMRKVKALATTIALICLQHASPANAEDQEDWIYLTGASLTDSRNHHKAIFIEYDRASIAPVSNPITKEDGLVITTRAVAATDNGARLIEQDNNTYRITCNNKDRFSAAEQVYYVEKETSGAYPFPKGFADWLCATLRK